MKQVLPFLCAASIAACAADSHDASLDSDLSSTPDLFGDPSTLELKLEGAFNTAFDAASAGLPNGPLPGLPRRTTEDFPGKLTFSTPSGDKTLDVMIKVRGNSSLVECPFPKLTVKLTDAAKLEAKNTIFAKQSKLKIGTHCDDDADDSAGTIGRLRNEKSPVRESYVYQALAKVLPTTLQTRVARITYVDTASNNAVVTRSAMLLEHIDKLAKRSGAEDHCRQVDGREECSPALTDSELSTVDPRDGMDRERIATTSLFEAAIGNWDWHLDVGARVTGPRVWNNEVILVPREGAPAELVKVPVAHDFDLASVVTGRLRGRDRHLTPAALQAQAKEFLSRTDGLRPEEIAAAKSRFLDKKLELYALTEMATLDEEGRQIARAHLDAFFAALEL